MVCFVCICCLCVCVCVCVCARAQLLMSGLRRGACSAAGWLAASELLLEEGAGQAALDAATQVGLSEHTRTHRLPHANTFKPIQLIWYP